MIRVAVIGAAGYTGGEAIRLLLGHPHVGEQNIVAVSRSHDGQPLHIAHEDLHGQTALCFVGGLADVPPVDVCILCLGHGASAAWLKDNPDTSRCIIIDLGNDHRIEGSAHEFVYGLPEVHRHRIQVARRIANPGCFATAIQLALIPLAETKQITNDVVVNAITGSTGAGQQPIATTHFSWRSDNVNTYKVFEHQHEPEMKQTLGDIALHFVPLRGPFARGIHANCVLPGTWKAAEVEELYRSRYADHPFVVVCDGAPDMKRVVNTNLCHVGVVVRDNALMVVSVIDNLLKGASGQAIQNMNIACGFDERAGLNLKSSVY